MTKKPAKKGVRVKNDPKLGIKGEAIPPEEAVKGVAAPEIEDPDEWAEKFWDCYSPAQHRGLSVEQMEARLNSISKYVDRNPPRS